MECKKDQYPQKTAVTLCVGGLQHEEFLSNDQPLNGAQSDKKLMWMSAQCYELVERLAYYGINSNLVIYFTEELHLSSVAAAKNVNNWVGVTTILPILGAFLADAYWGRYRAITYFSLAYVAGLILLTLSASVRGLKPSSCISDTVCPEANSVQLAFCFLSLYLIAIGTGGVKPCLEAFGADQFDEEDPVERKNKSSFFNWWYFGLCTGALLAFTLIVYIEDNTTWALGFCILAVLFTLTFCLFLAGTPFYWNKVPGASPLSGIFQVFIAAAWKWDIAVPVDDKLLYEIQDTESLQIRRRKLVHTAGLRCLDKAATRDLSNDGLWQHMNGEDNRSLISSGISAPREQSEKADNGCENPWRLCTVTQVEEAKLIVRILPIWLTTIMYGLVLAQVTTFFVEQAATLNRKVGSSFTIPSASLAAFSSVPILVLMPIYDCLFVPTVQRFTRYEQGLTLLQRVGVGMFLSVLCMATAALVEQRRLQIARDNGLLDDSTGTVPMSVFWLLPQYIIFGVSDVFAMVGQQEFFYDQVPDTMRSLGMSLYLCAAGLGSFASTGLISIVNFLTSRWGSQTWIVDNLNMCRLDYYYWLLAVLCALNLVVYIALAWSYTYKTLETHTKCKTEHSSTGLESVRTA